MDLKKPQPKRSRLAIIVSAAVAIAIILAIVLPLAIILPKKHHNSSSGSNGGSTGSGPNNSTNGTTVVPPQKITGAVLLSLYIYPGTNTSWQPLYDAIVAHPNLTFVCIVNPNSGPGDTQYPDSNYDPAVRQLNSYPNALTIGYVRTGYGTRDINTVKSEVDIYAGWANKSMELAMQGIFFDEAPHEYVAASVPYMQTLDAYVKFNATGLQGNRTVAHNPGVIPDPRYNDTNCDITVIFEEAYPIFEQRLVSIQQQPKTRSHYAFFINSVPTQSIDDLRTFVYSLAQLAQFLFITEETVDFYQSFGQMWSNFTDVIPIDQ